MKKNIHYTENRTVNQTVIKRFDIKGFKVSALFSIIFFLLFFGNNANAATYFSRATGEWSTNTTWSLSSGGAAVGAGIYPLAGDIVYIEGGFTVSSTITGISLACTDLSISSGSTLNIARPFSVSGNTIISGTINFSSTSATSRLIAFSGDVTLNSGSVWTEPASGNGANNTYTFGGNFTNNATTFSALGTGIHTFSGTSKTISGSTTTSIPSITISGTIVNSGVLTSSAALLFTGSSTNNGTINAPTLLTVTGATVALTNNGTVTATAALSGTGGLTQGTTGILNLGGTSGITTLTATAVGNIVNYTGAAQTIKGTTYDLLNLSGTGAKTLGAATVTNNTFTVNSGTTLSMSTFLLTLNGSFVNNSTASGTTGGVTISGTATQNIGGFTTTGTVSMLKTANTATFTGAVSGAGLTINGTGGTLNLGTSLVHSFSGAITLTAGTLNAGSSTMNLSSTGTVFSGTLANFNVSTGTVNYNRAGTQIAGAIAYNNLTLSGSGIKTVTGVTVNGILSMEGTSIVSVAPTYGATATLQYNTATARTAGVEWLNTFLASGGVIIKNTGVITLNAAKVLGTNTNVPLNINLNAGLNTSASNFSITFHGDFINSGTLTAGSSAITITGTTATHSIAGFTTTGLITLSKTGGIATFTSNVSGAGLTINGTGGTLNLGSGLTHTFTGTLTRTSGTLDGGTSTLILSGATPVSGSGGTFAASTGTVNYSRAGTQTAGALTYNNLTLSGTSLKTITGVTVNGVFSLEGTATASAAPTYGSSATLQYRGSAAQVTGVEFTSTFTANGGVKINNASGVTLNATKNLGSNPLVIGDVVLNTVFNDGGFVLTSTGSLNLNSGSYIVNASGLPAFTGGVTIASGTTVDYAATTSQTVKGLTYDNLTISGTGNNSKIADNNIAVNAVLNLNSSNASAIQGCLDLSSYTLTMGSAATTTGTGDVTGIVTRNSFVTNTSYSFGNQFTTINLQAGGILPASMSVKIALASSHSWKGDAINRFYDIAQTGGTSGTKATLNLHYLATELNGANEALLDLFDYHVGISTLHDHGHSNSSNVDKWVGLTNLSLTYLAPSTGFGSKYWTLGTSTSQSYVWHGASTDWTNTANWEGGIVPGSGNHVVIPDATTTAFDPTLPSNTTLGFVEIQAGGILNGGTGSTLTIDGGVGSWDNLGTFNPGTSTVVFTNTSATMSGSTSFFNINIANAANLTLGTYNVLNIGGSFTLTGTAVLNAASTINTIEYNGSGDQTVVLPNGSTSGYHNLILSGSGIKTLPSSAMVIYGYFELAGSATAVANQQISVLGNVTFGSGTYYNGGSGGYTHQISGDWINNGATFLTSNSSILFNNSTATQTIRGSVASQVFNSISINKSSHSLVVGGSVTSLTLNGDLNITSGIFDVGSATTFNIAGNLSNAGTFTTGIGTVNFNGTSAQTITGTNTFDNLTINNSNGVTANANQTVNGTLNLLSSNPTSSSGTLNLGSYTLTMGSNATTTGTGDVTGIIKRTSFLVNTPYSFGSQFTTINFASGGTLPSEINLKVVLSTSHTWKSDAINRYYDITQTGADALQKITLNLHYLTSELNSATEGDLDLFDYHVALGSGHDHGSSNFSNTDKWVGLANLSLNYIAKSSFDQKYVTLGTSTSGYDCTWTGISSGNNSDWNDAGNWTGGIPDLTSHVHIPSTTFHPILPAGSTTISKLIIESGGVLNTTAGDSLIIVGSTGSWDNLGTFNPGTSTVVFANSAATMADPTNFYNVTVADGAALTLGTDNIMRIAGSLFLSSTGVLNANNNNNTVVYNGVNQTIAFPNGSTVGYHNLIIGGSGIKTMPDYPLTVSGNLTLSGTGMRKIVAINDLNIGGVVSISANDTLDMSTSNLTIGTNISNSGVLITENAGLTLNGTNNQNVFGGTYGLLRISNTAGVTATGTLNTTSLTIDAGSTLDMGTNLLNSMTTNTGTGTLKTKNTSTTPIPTGKTWTGTLIYNGSSAQKIVAGSYTNLTSDNGVGLVLSDSATVSGTLLINDGKQMDIAAGAKMVADLVTNNAGTSGLAILSNSTTANGSLIFNNSSDLPVFATVAMYSKAAAATFSNGKYSNYKWQFFGIPVASVDANPTFMGSYVRKYEESGTTSSTLWVSQGNGSVLTPFDGYEITQAINKTLYFDGQLVNNDYSQILSYNSDAAYPGQHILSNPYTAAIDITKMNFGTETESTVYLYNTGSHDDWATQTGVDGTAGQYVSAPKLTAGIGGVPGQIPSMQGFLVLAKSSSVNATIGIPYSSVIRNTVKQRVRSAGNINSDKVYTRIDISGTRYNDKMWIFTDPTCTRAFDNGWDGQKFIGSSLSPQLWAMESDGDYQVDAVNDINNTNLGFIAGEDSNYTLTFTHENLNLQYSALYLIDLADPNNPVLTDITVSGTTYTFSADQASAPVNRFKIVTTPGIATAISNQIVENLNIFSSLKGNVIVQNPFDSTGKIVICDLSGKPLVSENFVAKGITSISCNLTPGTYIAKALTGNVNTNRKLIIR